MGGLDLVVLGLGMNGHVGMNEPGTPADAMTLVIDLAPSTIEAAREIWLLVSGERKAGILAATLDGPMTPDVPASLLRGHPGLRVIADDAAWPGAATKPGATAQP